MTARVSRATAEQEISDSAVDPSSFTPDTSSSSPVLALQPSQPVSQIQEEIFQHPHVESTEPCVDSEYESDARTFDDDAAQEVFDDFILCLPIDDRRMLAMLLTEGFRRRQKMGIVDAAREAGSIVGYSDRTVRDLRKQFWDNEGMLDERRQGKYEQMMVCKDEQLNKKAAEWVRENAFKKGEPNMTAQSYCLWLNEHLLPSSHLPPYFPRRVSLRTSIRWLHHLGFKPVSHRKGVYIDGHEREDIVFH